MSSLPTGTVTFLFTDIEGSTRLWQEKPEAMSSANARHDAILREAIESNNGYIFQIVGDSFSAAFHNAHDGLQAVVAAQRGLQTEDWGNTGAIKVRMGLHTGAAEISSDRNYEGYTTIAYAQRVMSAAYGGQVLLTRTTYDLVQDQLPGDITLRDMGEHHLKDLHTPLHLYQVNIPDLQQNFPPIKSLDTLPNNLPTQLTSFIGREKEATEIKDLLNASRLVTLTASGGTGKTRLSIEVGAQLLTSFPNGVWLIELAPLADPSQIIPTMAQIFGLQEHPFGPLPILLMDYLRDKKILLILDNCEHLIQACARLAHDLLHQCTGLKILASSREALGIAGEVAYHTPSLADSESMRLFVERARAVNPKFSLSDSNTSAVTQICHRLDGIPLAIELAAARSKLLSAEQIAARLDDLFRLLVGGSRTALPRQQTLRALIDWSYDLLTDEEKRLLQFASVFVGGWTLDALEAVADNPNTLELLEQLVNKSLVVAEEHGNEMRFFMLETIRQYAREKLFEAKQAVLARDRHFIYFDKLSEKMWDVFRSADMVEWRDRADDEAENFRAAIEWGLAEHIEEAVHLAGFYCVLSSWMSKQAEGIGFVQTALEKVKSLPPVEGDANSHRQKLIARALFAEGMVSLGQGNMQLVIQALQEAIRISRLTEDKLILGYSLEMLYVASNFIKVPSAQEAAQEGLRIFTDELPDSWGLSMAYQNMVRLAIANGNSVEKEKYLGKLKEQLRDVPLSFQAGLFFLGMGMGESVQGNYQEATQFFEDGLKIFKRLRNKNFQTALTSELGHIARHTGDINQARQIYTKTLTNWQDLGNRAAIAHQLECFGFLALADEEPQRTIQLFGAAEALRERINSSMTDYEQAEYSQAITQLRSMLTEAEFNFLWAEGRSMTLEQAIQFALDDSYRSLNN
jgi:predicted ATPase/class 3 adenylate cyclase